MMISISTSLFAIPITLVLAGIVARIVYLCYFHPLARYPGPFWARVTDLWTLKTFLTSSTPKTTLTLHKTHGRTLRVSPNWLSFSTIQDFETIYGFHKSIEKGDFYNIRRSQNNRKANSASPGSLFSVRSEAEHRVKRRRVQGPALLSGGRVVGYGGVVCKGVSAFLSRVEGEVWKCNREGTTGSTDSVNIAPLVHRFVLRVLLEVIWGVDLVHSFSASLSSSSSPEKEEKDVDVDAALDAAAAAICADLRSTTKNAWSYSLSPWYGWVMNSRFVSILRRLRHNNKNPHKENQLQPGTGLSFLLTETRKFLFSHSEKLTSSQQPSIVGNWLNVPEDDTNRMPLPDMWAEGFNLVIAGPGSTSAALTAILFMLGTEEGQVWQERIRGEMDAASSLKGSGGGGALSIPPSLNAIIKETLRLYPPFPTGFPRTITAGAENIFSPPLPTPLPIGTTVSANIYVLGRSKNLWGDDAELWSPNRWLVGTSPGIEDKDKDYSPQKRKELESKFVAFSKGSRGCVGKDLAMLVLSKAVIGVLGRWRLRSLGELTGKSFLEVQYEDCWVCFEEVGGPRNVE